MSKEENKYRASPKGSRKVQVLLFIDWFFIKQYRELKMFHGRFRHGRYY